MLYHEVALDSPSNRGHIVPVQDLKKYIGHPGTVFYSTYAFGEDGVAYIKRHGALRKESGVVAHLRTVWLDIDDKSLQEAVHKTIEVIYFLRERGVGPSGYRIWFSGQKGFHLQLPAGIFRNAQPSADLPHLVSETISKELGGGLVDVSPLRSVASMIRMPYTLHTGSGLWKVPVDRIELDYVLERARKPEPEPLSELSANPIWTLVAAAPSPSFAREAKSVAVTEVGHPAGIVPYLCAWQMYGKGPVKGSRHVTLLRMASMWRRLGLPLEAALALGQAWLGVAYDKEFERVIINAYEVGYEYGCHDPVMAAHCVKKCLLYKSRAFQPTSAREWTTALISLRRAQEGGVPLDGVLKRPLTIPAGSLIILTGDTGMGKSALAQTIAVRGQVPTLYINTEVGHEVMVRRFFQIAYQLGAEDVLRHIEQLDPEPLQHIQMISDHPDVQTLRRLCEAGSYRLIVVDTTDDILTQDRSDLDRAKRVIETLRAIAQRTKAVVLALHHINKSAAVAGRIDLNALTGTRSVVTKADYVWAVTGERYGEERLLRTLKDRDGLHVETALKFNRQTFTMEKA